jgi:hypothetical protein
MIVLELIDGMPDHVVAVRASGEVTDDDYEAVLVPAIDDRRTRHDKIRLLYVLGEEFTGYEADAVWEDAKLGMRTMTAYDRIAVVADATWMRRAVSAFGWLMPGEVRVFGVADLDEATSWIGA